jgi:hypothetical protein
MQAQLTQLETDYGIEWQEYRLGDLFDIHKTSSFNKDKLIIGNDYDYITRTSQNQGILQQTGFVNKSNINEKGTWSLGLLQMDFFYRQKPWYAGQFMRKISSKIDLSPNAITYFTVLLNSKKRSLLSGLVRDVDATFLNSFVSLPTVRKNGEVCIAFDYMVEFVATLKAERLATLKAERLATLKAYLTVTGLNNTTLTPEEETALARLDSLTWQSFKIEDVLVWQQGIVEINPLHLDKLSVSREKKYPFYGQAISDNGIIEYVDLQDALLNNKQAKPTILIHSNNQNIVYHQTPFYLKDGHGATSVLQSEHLNKVTAQFLIAAIKRVILQKYNYNAKATKIELKNTKIDLPVTPDGVPDYDFMEVYVSAMQKVAIQHVMAYLNQRIDTTESLV